MTNSAEGQRLPALDGIRGVAILMVIAAHAAVPQLQALGAAGVTVFFVLSGFLITTILIGHSSEGGGSLRRFYARRARRLLPALALLLVFEAGLRLSTGQSMTPVLLAAGYATNFAAAAGHGSTLDHTWSLALEEQFYLLWPLLLPLVVRRRRAVALVVVAALVSATARVVLWSAGLTYVAWFSPVTRADAILVGCALALARARGWTLPRGPRRAALLTAAIACLVAPFVLKGSLASLWLIPLVAVATAVLTALAVESTRGPVPWLLSTAPLRVTGRLSYAVYLWHPLALTVVTFAAIPNRFLGTWALSLAIATVSWFVVERHFLGAPSASRVLAEADRTAERQGRDAVATSRHPDTGVEEVRALPASLTQ